MNCLCNTLKEARYLQRISSFPNNTIYQGMAYVRLESISKARNGIHETLKLLLTVACRGCWMPVANEVLGCPRKYFLFMSQNFQTTFSFFSRSPKFLKFVS